MHIKMSTDKGIMGKYKYSNKSTWAESKGSKGEQSVAIMPIKSPTYRDNNHCIVTDVDSLFQPPVFQRAG